MKFDELDELERNINKLIAYHRQAYERAVAPLFERLTEIHRLRPGRMMVPLQDAIDAGDSPPS